jgi:hypothetical protein
MNKRQKGCAGEKTIPQAIWLSTGLLTSVYTSFTDVVPIKNVVERRLSTYSTRVNDVVKNKRLNSSPITNY